MRPFFRTILPTSLLSVLLIVSCATKSDIEDLQEQIDNLTNTRIASINQQVASIQKSIGDLTEVDRELNALISELREDLDGLNGEIRQALVALEQEDAALDQRIKDLKTYCEQQDNDVKSWAATTFATLEQHGSVLAEIAGIKTRLGELTQMISNLDTTLSQKITTAENSVKGWVNEHLAGYYTIAQMDAKLQLLEAGYTGGDEALSGEIATLRNNLETAKSDLTSAYQTAIGTAIEQNNGVINAKIAADIKTATDALQDQIDGIKLRLDNIESRLSILEGKVAELIGMIQSIVVVPDFSNGSVKISVVKDNMFRFEVYPLEAAAAIAEKGPSILSLDYVVTQTKSSEDFHNLPVSEVSFTGKTLLLTVDGISLSDTLTSGKASANARLKISNGTITKSSPYFPLYSTLTAVDFGLSVKWANLNLGATELWEPGDYYAWGDTEPYYTSLNPLVWREGKDTGYSWSSYQWTNGDDILLTKYNTDSSLGNVDNKTILDPSDDAAHIVLGGKWRMPTKDEWNELINSSEFMWTANNGINGYVFRRNGKELFIPVAGVFTNQELLDDDKSGNYWASTLCVEDPTQADRVGMSVEGDPGVNTRVRRRGQLIRAVYDDR